MLNVMDTSKSFSLFKPKEGNTKVTKDAWHTKVPNILDANKMMHAHKTTRNDNDMIQQRFENQYVNGSNLNKNRTLSETKTATQQQARTHRNHYKSMNVTNDIITKRTEDVKTMFHSSMKPKQWRNSYDTNEINAVFQHSRYAHVSKNEGQDCAATTYGRFGTHTSDTHGIKSSVPDEIPIFA